MSDLWMRAPLSDRTTASIYFEGEMGVEEVAQLQRFIQTAERHMRPPPLRVVCALDYDEEQ